MKPLSNAIVLFDRSLARSMGYSNIDCRDVTDGLAAIRLENRALPEPPAGYAISRYLDRFLVVLPICSGAERDSVLQRFFAWLAPEYDSAIDVGRNEENIRNLLDLLESRLAFQRPRRILDFGCGTGLAIAPIQDRGSEYVGYDSCALMRAAARLRGGVIVDGDGLRAAPMVERFEAVIASYVMHFRPGAESLRLVRAVLRPNGVFVANFHKGVGLIDFKEFAEDHGMLLEVISGDQHGVYVVATKSGVESP